jgi:DNA-binding beta-propeller fold protein YncE
MGTSTAKRHSIKLVALAAVLALVAAACQQAAPTPSAQPEASAAPATVATTVQSAKLEPAAAGAKPSGWETPEAIRGQLSLLAKFDSSGPAAWDPAKHPNVYISSMSYPVKREEGKVYGNGFYIVDSVTKEVVTSRVYDLGEEMTTYPHSVGASPDGQWFYFMAQDRPAATKANRPLIMIVNAKTLKLDKVLTHPTQRLHHVGGFKDYAGKDRVILNLGFGATGGPHFLLDPKDDNKVVQAITFDQVRPMGHPYTAPSPDGKFLYISMGAPEIREADSYAASVAKYDIEKKTATVIHGTGNHPIGITHTVDGKFTYVVDGTNSLVFKIDNKENKVVAKTSAGVAGPYGARLNWDETKLFLVGKGEGSHNRGGVLGMIDTKTFQQSRQLPQMPINLTKPGDDNVLVASVDHAILHPDPAVNELWVSNMAGNNTIVLDLATYKVKAWIMTPNGGNTHSGAFLRYDKDFKGELLADMFGPQAAQREVIKQKVAQVK